MQKAPWLTAVTAAALLALPIAAFAQPQPPTNPPQQPPATATDRPPAAQPPAGQGDQTAARQHLSEARNTLSAMTSMPEAAKLQGEARTQISQLISNFNALITTQSEWRAAYAKVDANLTALLGPDAADKPVGTSGSTALDPAIRAKLTEFRTHLKAFEAAAGASDASPTPPSAAPSAPPSAPPSTSPAAAAGAANPTASPEASAGPNADAQKELDAISAILSGSKTGALTKEETAQLKTHVEALRALLSRK